MIPEQDFQRNTPDLQSHLHAHTGTFQLRDNAVQAGTCALFLETYSGRSDDGH